jgi:hypothetical protein
VTRRDLPPGDQLAQTVHAALAYGADYPEHRVAEGSLVCLVARDELELCWLTEQADRAGLATATFREPDLGYELTAIALEARAARLCSKYPLTFSQREEVNTSE